MVIIVDYDNLPTGLRSKGPRTIAERLCERLLPLMSPDVENIILKLYGGWYLESGLTQSAQQLHSAIYDDFPFFCTLPSLSFKRLLVTASLSHSLEINPKQTLPNTYRQRSRKRRGRWDTPTSVGCTDQVCPLSNVIDRLQKDVCWADGCSVKPSDLVSPEPEQKMVDTMMVADIIYIANRGDETVAVVTSDDDVWPGIISAMITGTTVLHVQPKPSSRAWPYSREGEERYISVPL